MQGELQEMQGLRRGIAGRMAEYCANCSANCGFRITGIADRALQVLRARRLRMSLGRLRLCAVLS
jgi:hypothetical protein